MRIEKKIKQLEKTHAELETIKPNSFDAYQNLVEKAASERYIEKITEDIISIALRIIRIKKFEEPEDDEHIFTLLSKNNIITNQLAQRLIELKGMRNIIIHEYAEIDDKIVYNALQNNLEQDVQEFIKQIKHQL